MPHVIYDVSSPTAGEYFDISNNLQTGAGYFQGNPWQRGYGRGQRGRGIMGVLSKAWRYLGPLAKKYVAPLAKKALHALAEEGLDTGSKVLGDVVEGKEVGDALRTHGKQAAKNIMRKAGSKLTQAGSGKHRRKAIKKKKKGGRKQSVRSMANLRLVGRHVLESAAKRGRRADTLGLY